MRETFLGGVISAAKEIPGRIRKNVGIHALQKKKREGIFRSTHWVLVARVTLWEFFHASPKTPYINEAWFHLLSFVFAQIVSDPTDLFASAHRHELAWFYRG